MVKEKTSDIDCVENNKYEAPAVYSEVIFCPSGAESGFESPKTADCILSHQAISTISESTVRGIEF